MESTVRWTGYLFGAGASKAAGYPLASEVKLALGGFLSTIKGRPECRRLEKWTEELLKLLNEKGLGTLDELAWELRAESNGQIVLWAKAVMTALFFEIERTANLSVYRNHLRRIIDFSDLALPDHDDRVRVPSSSFVMSYNYDRCLEAAAFHELQASRPHGTGLEVNLQRLLNGGLDLMGERHRSIDTRRFSVLKMHGTVGTLWDLPGFEDGLRSEPLVDFGQVAVSDNLVAEFDRSNQLESPTMIVFPWETSHIHENARAFLAEVDRAAGEFLSRTETLFVVGYSFPSLNESRLKNLFEKAKNLKHVVVIDPNPTTAERAQALFLKVGINPSITTQQSVWT